MDDLQAQIEALFQGEVVCRVGPLTGDIAQLLPDELDQARGFAPRRQREFATGRVLARRALTAIGESTVAIVIGEQRAPIWPAGIVGSISHTDALCAVVLARRERFESLGLDLEHEAGLDEEAWPGVLTSDEHRAVLSHPAIERRLAATLVLSAKEAFHKVQHPLTATMLDFHDVETEWEGARGLVTGEFLVRVLSDRVPALPPVLRGRFARAHGHVMTALSLGT